MLLLLMTSACQQPAKWEDSLDALLASQPGRFGTVKLPVAALALEKLNRLNLPDLSLKCRYKKPWPCKSRPCEDKLTGVNYETRDPGYDFCLFLNERAVRTADHATGLFSYRQ
jgi:hypothetical protein